VRFEWDETKDASNYRKHRVRFETAAQVFGDPHCLMTQDREVDGEERWQTIGMVEGVLLLFVAHTVDDDQDEDLSVRILSARKVTPEERRRYEAAAN
jgi:uncharacterized DUF497 family protein